MDINLKITKYNILSKLILERDSKKLPKDLYVKIIRLKLNYKRFYDKFTEDLENFKKEVMSEEFLELSQKENKTLEDMLLLEKLQTELEELFRIFIKQKVLEECPVNINDTFSEDEYIDIVDLNSDKDVEINGLVIKIEDFLESFYNLFVNQND